MKLIDAIHILIVVAALIALHLGVASLKASGDKIIAEHKLDSDLSWEERLGEEDSDE